MRTPTFLLSLVLLIGCGSPESTRDRDHELAKKLAGTWLSAPSEALFNSKATYRADGTGVERVWPVGQPESSAVVVETRWAITNGVLVIDSVASSDSMKIPPGIHLEDRILRLKESEVVFEPFAGYNASAPREVRKVRVKEGF